MLLLLLPLCVLYIYHIFNKHVLVYQKISDTIFFLFLTTTVDDKLYKFSNQVPNLVSRISV
jgi:hypothetical protein